VQITPFTSFAAMQWNAIESNPEVKNDMPLLAEFRKIMPSPSGTRQFRWLYLPSFLNWIQTQ
jgi:hypothetical protein